MTGRPPRRVDVTGELTILTAAEQAQRLCAELAGGAGLSVGLAGVTDLDTAGLQVLLLLRDEGRRRGAPVEFTDHSPAVTDTLAVARLGPDLEHTDPATGAGDPLPQAGPETQAGTEAQPGPEAQAGTEAQPGPEAQASTEAQARPDRQPEA